MTAERLREWLDGDDGRWNDVFALWVQGKRCGYEGVARPDPAPRR